MKKYYQKPETKFISLDMAVLITTGDDTELGVESNPFLAAVLEDEATQQ